MAVAIVDPSGNLVYYEKMEIPRLPVSNVSVDKARTAAIYKRPTKAIQDVVAEGGAGLRMLRMRDATPVEGGIPLVADGKIIGAIGVSGDASPNDGICATAGAAVVK